MTSNSENYWVANRLTNQDAIDAQLSWLLQLRLTNTC